jgi:hypothetical protein
MQPRMYFIQEFAKLLTVFETQSGEEIGHVRVYQNPVGYGIEIETGRAAKPERWSAEAMVTFRSENNGDL